MPKVGGIRRQSTMTAADRYLLLNKLQRERKKGAEAWNRLLSTSERSDPVKKGQTASYSRRSKSPRSPTHAFRSISRGNTQQFD